MDQRATRLTLGVPNNCTLINWETPFLLTYIMEVVIPIEIEEPSRKTEAPPDEEMNNVALQEELDLVEEILT